MKNKCCKCDAIAVWFYGPMTDWKDLYYCDNCISRGCSCNILNEETGEQYKDELGRELPCCEYDFSDEGFEDRNENDE